MQILDNVSGLCQDACGMLLLLLFLLLLLLLLLPVLISGSR